MELWVINTITIQICRFGMRPWLLLQLFHNSRMILSFFFTAAAAASIVEEKEAFPYFVCMLLFPIHYHYYVLNRIEI